LNDLGARVRIARNALQRSTVWRRDDLQLILSVPDLSSNIRDGSVASHPNSLSI